MKRPGYTPKQEAQGVWATFCFGVSNFDFRIARHELA